jgi:hypothetical protein
MHLSGRVKSIVLHDAVTVNQGIADHAAQLGVSVGAVRA